MDENKTGMNPGQDTSTAMPAGNGPAATQVEGAEFELPDGVSERTKQQFEKLKAHNAEMAAKLAELENKNMEPIANIEEAVTEALAGSTQHSNLTKAEVTDIAQGIVDEQGYLNETELARRLKEADDRVKAAEKTAREAAEKIAKFETKQVLRDVYRDFPELDSYSASFDPRMQRFFYNELMSKPVGQRNVAEAAKAAKEFFSNLAPQPKKDETKNREQATATVEPSSRSTGLDDDELVARTRKGDMDALAERLRRAGA